MSMTTKDFENRRVGDLTNLELFSVLKNRISDNRDKSNKELPSRGPILFSLNTSEDVLNAKRMLMEAGDIPCALLLSTQALLNLHSLGKFPQRWEVNYSRTSFGNIFGIPVYEL